MITCPKCGETMGDDIKFCPSCGTGTSTATQTAEPVQPVQTEAAPQVPAAPVYTTNTNTNSGTSNSDVNFGTAIKNFVTKIVDFRSTTCKKEYWFGFLFFVIVIAGAGVADYIPFVRYASLALQLAACLAFISMTVRRLNDLGKSWKRIFMYLIPVYGQILFFQELTK